MATNFLTTEELFGKIKTTEELFGKIPVGVPGRIRGAEVEKEPVFTKKDITTRAQTFVGSQPEKTEKGEPTWGEVIKHSLKSGLASYQGSLLNVFRIIQMGGVKLTDSITDIFDKDWYDPNKDFVLNTLTKLVEESEQISAVSDEQRQSKDKLKQFIGTGLQAAPQIVGAGIIGLGVPTAGALQLAKWGEKKAEFITRLTQMSGFGAGAFGGSARQIEQEYEALGKEAPYLKMVLGATATAIGEVGTELPVFTGVMRLLSGKGKKLVEKGAKRVIMGLGKKGIAWVQNIALQAWQEAFMEPISMSINSAIGLPQDWSELPERMKQGAYGGFAMAVVLAGAGGSFAGSAKIIDLAINKNQNLKEVTEEIRKVEPTITEAMAREEELKPKVEPKTPKEIQQEVKEEQFKKEISKEEYREEPISVEKEVPKMVGKELRVELPTEKVIPKVKEVYKAVEIPKISVNERNLLEITLELEKGKILPGGDIRSVKTNEKAKAKLLERGLMNKEGYLTEKGLELSEVLKGRIEAEEKGIPITEREKKKPMSDKAFAKQGINEALIIGKIGDDSFYSDSHIMLKGEIKDVPISDQKPKLEDIVPEGEGTKIEPVMFSKGKTGFAPSLVWFDNKIPVQEEYYDFITKKFPKAEFRSVEEPGVTEGSKPIKIYSEGEFVGVVMPMKIEADVVPENIRTLGEEREVVPEEVIPREEEFLERIKEEELEPTAEEGKVVEKPRERAGLEAVEGIGKEKERTVAQRIAARAIEANLSEEIANLPIYRQVDLRQQAEQAVDFIQTNPSEAYQVAMGNIPAPKGLLPEAVMLAVEDKAIAEGDATTLKELATESNLIEEGTTMGQRIRAHGQRGKLSPVKKIMEVVSTKEKAFRGDLNKAKATEVANIKENIKKQGTKEQLTNLINEIEC